MNIDKVWRSSIKDSLWTSQKVYLGNGIIKIQGLTRVSKVIDTIQDFGIDMDMLDSMDLGYDELHQLYNHINFYRGSVRYLKKLKNEMARKNHEV